MSCGLLWLSACHSSGSSPSSPSVAAPANLDSVLTLTLSDPVGDLQIAPQEGPPSLVPYPQADVTSVRLGIDGQYLYVQVTYASAIPGSAVTIPAQAGMPQQFVRQQGISFNFNVDGNDHNGASAFPVITGIDIFFAIEIRYGAAPMAYANYDFAGGDVHQNRQHLDGVIVEGGAGSNRITARYDVSALGNFFPRGANVVVGGWSEAESSDAAGNTLFHHFAYDPYTASSWTIPR